MTNRKAKNKNQREPHQKKKTQPRKSMRKQPETKYGEVKKNASYSLTPTGANLIKKISKQLEISASEFLERIARGEIQVETTSADYPELDCKTDEFCFDQNQ